MKKFKFFKLLVLCCFFQIGSEHLQAQEIDIDFPVDLELLSYEKLDYTLNNLIKQPNERDGQLCFQADKVQIEVYVDQLYNVDQLLEQLQSLGFKVQINRNHVLIGWYPIAALTQLNALDYVQSVKALPKIMTDMGSVDNQADAVMFTNTIKNAYGIDGSDVKIGIISSSFNLRGDSAELATIITGDLPGPKNPNGYTERVVVLQEGEEGLFPEINTDEGRAIAEIIHDIAPGAKLYFHALLASSEDAMLDAARALVAEGCDIVIDDITLLNATPVYQQSRLALQIEEWAADGILYFTSAGNEGKGGTDVKGNYFYDAEARFVGRAFGGVLHSFNAESKDTDLTRNDFLMEFELEDTDDDGRARAVLVAHWDEPWGEICGDCRDDEMEVKVIVINRANNKIFLVADQNNLNRSVSGLIFDLRVNLFPKGLSIALWSNNVKRPNRVHLSVSSKELKFVKEEGRMLFDAPTLLGHKNTPSAFSIGASSWYNTPIGREVWNVSKNPKFDPIALPVVGHADGGSIFTLISSGNPFNTPSAYGGQPILFDPSGNRLEQPIQFKQPVVVAPDGGETTFFAYRPVAFPGTFLFYGTSASAPAAAAAALIKQAAHGNISVDEMRQKLTSTALDMDDPFTNGLQENVNDPLFSTGFDFSTGHGLIQPRAALEQLFEEQGQTFIQDANLVNSTTGQYIALLNNNIPNFINVFDLEAFDIEPVVNGQVGSVVYELDGEPFSVVNTYPFTFKGREIAIGKHTLIAKPYSGTDGTGRLGISRNIQFEVVNTKVDRFEVIDINADTMLFNLKDGDSLDPVPSVNILPIFNAQNIGSVRFQSDKYTIVENEAPFYIPSIFLKEGEQNLKITPFRDIDAKGLEGESTTINFTVLPFQHLRLVAQCKNAKGEGKYLLTNPNRFAVTIDLSASDGIRLENEQSGGSRFRQLNIPSGETNIYAQLIFGRIGYVACKYNVGDNNGNQYVLKRSNWSNCAEDNNNARVAQSAIMEEEKYTEINIYPNPAEDKLVINSTIEDLAEMTNLQVIDLQGKVLHQQQIISPSSIIELNLNEMNLSKGLYLLRVQTKTQGTKTYRFTKK